MKAFVALRVKNGQIHEVAEQLADLEGVRAVYSVTGAYDLLAEVHIHDADALDRLVTGHICQAGGVTASDTMVAVQVHSRRDMERMFGVGLDVVERS